MEPVRAGDLPPSAAAESNEGTGSRGRVYLKDLAAILDRTQHTIRQWEAQGLLPKSCIPKRDDRGWRYWTPSQIQALETWVDSRIPQSHEKLAKLRNDREEQRGRVIASAFDDGI